MNNLNNFSKVMETIAGPVLIVAGLGIIIYNIKDRKNEKNDTYGGRMKLYGGATIMIVLGITLILTK